MKQNIYDDPEFFQMYHKLRQTRVTYNDFIEQPAIKRLLPELKDLKVLDLGCGFGELAKYCVDQGAQSVHGIDISKQMLSIAHKDPRITYHCMAMEDLFFERGAFDLIVSSLAFHYVENFKELMMNISNWLTVNGYLVFSTEHPVVLSRKEQSGWIENSDREKLYWPIDHYGEEGIREQFWGVEGVIKYHRKLSTLINTLLENDFMIERMEEPESTPEGLSKMPKLINERRRPSFLLIKAKKKMWVTKVKAEH
ncbi:bifunctional 2-polyprenyl-6-hydroxyphenol methylase/3-demethylubiquinol 3-O-methyltransferase UbiG [Paenibacillus sp. J2TS4]|uniref:class I SAM-dependent methyltransferase n=1 Tax=Paenibacillus sp. J2TS4 TaxID=2807194 RepID=UPI001B1C3B46|nr:class I SAM-dependent methyltransferase [Paenibacillus sp. J2TS4]GIP32108.1 methyltransferase [Paenibacillus sp. J2TS4]